MIPDTITSTDDQIKLRHLLLRNPQELFYYALDLARTPLMALHRRRMKFAQNHKPIGYIGWLGHGNFGDEALFEAIKASFSPYLLAPFADPLRESMFERFGLGGPAVFRAAVLGGGTLINPYYLPAAKLVKKTGLPFFTIGTGVGSPGFNAPLEPELDPWGDVLHDCPLVSVRGPLSFESLQRLGIHHAEIIGDPALAMTPETTPDFQNRQRLVINLAQDLHAGYASGKYAIFRKVQEIARDFTRTGGDVVGVALGPRDRATLEAFRSESKLPKMTIEEHHYSAQNLMKTIAGSVGLIGVRLHAGVFACATGVPTVLLSYRSKCDDFMSSMDAPQFAVPLSTELPASSLEGRWHEILTQPKWGRTLHAKALFWKRKQEDFYRRLIARLTCQ